jgi:SAM-dependent methyltransferase
MDETMMKATLAVDEHHWWYRGRRRVIRAELDRLPLPAAPRILDAGCGSGRTLVELAGYGGVLSGIELNTDAAQLARDRGLGEVRVGRLEELPWEDAVFDLITCLDVIEHVPDDVVALGELRRVARPGGWLLVTVPAYQALWSRHDEANHHFRRYSRSMLRAAARSAGWGWGA